MIHAACWSHTRRGFIEAQNLEPSRVAFVLERIGDLCEIEREIREKSWEGAKKLEVFLSDPDVSLDTNHLERTLRPIPMGRKAWLFCSSEVGAERIGQIQSLIATCILQGIDPTPFLVDVLQHIDSHPQSDIQALTPRL